MVAHTVTHNQLPTGSARLNFVRRVLPASPCLETTGWWVFSHCAETDLAMRLLVIRRLLDPECSEIEQGVS